MSGYSDTQMEHAFCDGNACFITIECFHIFLFIQMVKFHNNYVLAVFKTNTLIKLENKKRIKIWPPKIFHTDLNKWQMFVDPSFEVDLE